MRCDLKPPLPYRDGLPTFEELEAERQSWQQIEDDARRGSELATAADARAMLERNTRRRTRTEGLPVGEFFPFPVTMWKMGDAIWLAVEGEPYNLLQRRLRERFADRPIIVITLANGSRVSYLPSADSYGKGIYQEGNAVLKQGALELLIDRIAEKVEQLLGEA